MSSASQALPPAQQRLFDKMNREYSNREYTKALRTSDGILSIAPEHVDTLAVRGLILYNLERVEEGYGTIKQAILLNPRSMVAWHSLGMCQRLDKKYADALKAFKRALSFDASSTEVLRDIASACVQVRDWPQFLDAREKMVTAKPSVRANWVAVSCGHRLLGHSKLAAAVMDVMTSIMDAGDTPIEVSEAHLYRVELELESGAPHRALELLKKHDAEIVDAETKLLLRAKAHAQLGQCSEAEKRYMEVIGSGVSEADSIAALAQLHKIPLDRYLRPLPGFTEKYMEMLDRVLAAYPKCDYARRHALDCMPLEHFSERLAAFATPYILRMIPSLFSVLKSLYVDSARAAKIGDVFTAMEQELAAKDFSRFGGEANPCFIMWVHTFLASHYRRMGDYAKAHEYIDKAIAHTPTLELLYLEKAKILAREGKTAEAAQQADFARQLDLQDKYLNSKAAKYYFRDNQIEQGETTLQMFYKPSTVEGDTYLTALESQCYWYECEVGEAFYRKGDYISALQNLLMFEHHHEQNHCELSDFHNYVFRRNTMRPWFDVLECDDKMDRNKFFLKFCPALVRTYIQIHLKGEEAVRAAHVPRPELSLDGVSADEVKRIKQQQHDYCLTDIDLSEPLVKANRYMAFLLKHRGAKTDTHTLAVELYTVAEKPLLVARALQELHRLQYKQTKELAAEFKAGLYAKAKPTADARVQAVMDEILDAVTA
ncbi:putative N-acetyltransferase subunit Nat1 [Leptomonas seymouri]|uniref:Putative N-acetyltransferase subunit Nat1 n=1 Tax=Leptomonas seymouri TaxID=5684 RepID=A0A0N0P2R8_LEPSE|nr:putative N-acetyltransferase subunit Nat1 [Leptomonas seymouri]|eukprot:KPI83276.1 putative N-acetyltransferase subunit Nat1 [Leptomonas seymouri]